MKLATLCYLMVDEKTLLLHRVKKDQDMHEGKWVGVGGKIDSGETPEECVKREFLEETGLKLKNPKLKGILTFPKFSKDEDWYVFLFQAKEYSGEIISSNEGNLKWIENNKIKDLPMWSGDHKFLEWLNQKKFFSAKFEYTEKGLKDYHVDFY